jgi:hypothetical protein
MSFVAPSSSKRTGDGRAGPGRYSYDRGDFTWRWHQDGTWSLHVEGRRCAVLDVVRDETHPQMWRIRCPDDRLSDIVNLSRAKDAAISVALGILNRSRESAPVTPPMRQNESPTTLVPSDSENAPEPAALSEVGKIHQGATTMSGDGDSSGGRLRRRVRQPGGHVDAVDRRP